MFPFGGGGVRGVRLTRSHKGDWLHVPTYCLLIPNPLLATLWHWIGFCKHFSFGTLDFFTWGHWSDTARLLCQTDTFFPGSSLHCDHLARSPGAQQPGRCLVAPSGFSLPTSSASTDQLQPALSSSCHSSQYQWWPLIFRGVWISLGGKRGLHSLSLEVAATFPAPATFNVSF